MLATVAAKAAGNSGTAAIKVVGLRNLKIAILLAMGNLGIIVAIAAVEDEVRSSDIIVIISIQFADILLVKVNTTAVMDNRRNLTHPASVTKMAWEAQKAPCGLVYPQNLNQECVLRHF